MNPLLLPRREFSSEFRTALHELRRERRRPSPEAHAAALRALAEMRSRQAAKDAGEDADGRAQAQAAE